MYTEISLDALLNQVEEALEKELGYAPRLLISLQDNSLPAAIVCDVEQIIQLLVVAVTRILASENAETTAIPFVKIELHSTYLYYAMGETMQNDLPAHSGFPALAIVISTANTATDALPKVKERYQDSTKDKGSLATSQEIPFETIDLRKKK